MCRRHRATWFRRIPANIAGQQVLIGGDIILEIDGVELTPGVMADVRHKLPQMPPGSIIRLKVLRAGKIIQLSAPY